MSRADEVVLRVATAAQMHDLGRRLAGLLRAGDLVVLTGDLGAGKTTLTQGIGEGLGVRGRVTSPTFVIARVHPARGDGPDLVHVDAYRLGGLAEVDDLDLDASLAESVTVVEWGEGLAEPLSQDRLEIRVRRRHGGPDTEDVEDADGGTGHAGDGDAGDGDVVGADGVRRVELLGTGERWRDVPLVGPAWPHPPWPHP